MTGKRLAALLLALLLSLLLSSCATVDDHGTIAELDEVAVELKDVDVEGGLDKAMAGYQKFLEETPESQLTPEAMRRLADLKVEKEYGVSIDDEPVDTEATTPAAEPTTKAISAIGAIGASGLAGDGSKDENKKGAMAPVVAGKAEKEFEKSATQQQPIESGKAQGPLQLPKGEPGADLQNAGAQEAIKLYKKLLEKYPMYERNDQVLYQLSRAYEETGQVDEAMEVMNRLVKQFPDSRYNDEVHFRRGEYYFTRKKYLDAEEAYGESLKYGVGSVYYERALYKKGWTFYKQELYEMALDEFFTLLDYKVSIGFDFDNIKSDIEKKRIDDTFRVVSLGFSNLGGAAELQNYFTRKGGRSYEHSVYKQLAEFYFDKRRYSDAATTYNTFIDANPFHKKSPHFSMRVIEIFMKGNFPRLVIEAKKSFASTYGIHAEYWNYFNQAEYPQVLGYLKTNITDLANHYHALYQNKKFSKDKPKNFNEAVHWYREFLKSFPQDEQSPAINYQLADLFLENKDFKLAAVEYERSAYDYPVNDKSPKAAYAAVYAYREYLKKAPAPQIKDVKREIIRTSLRLVDTFPKHEKATIVLGAAADDLFAMRDFTLAIKVGRRLIEEYPGAKARIRRGAWLVVAHSSYKIEQYRDAELAYIEVLNHTDTDSKERKDLVENLAASIYKQGEQAREQEQYTVAVSHFLRIADAAPNSKIRPSAEYDAAAVLIQIMDLEQAATVLLSFRQNYPGHELQKDVTKKIAFVYKELGKFGLAAKEYERIAAEAKDEDLVREAMLTAAELYEKDTDTDNALRVYKSFVMKFPKPLEFALDTYYKIAMIHKSVDDLASYRKTLQHIINTDATAGEERTDRTRYLAAQSSLVIIEPRFDDFIALKLVKPFKVSLGKKQKSMKALVADYTRLVDYKVADVTAASTFYIAEIYYNFARSLLESERPEGLSDLELEEFNLMIEDTAFPFEEKAITVHEKNIELLTIGVYSSWIDRSIEKLAKLLPARYNKPEETTNYIAKLDNYRYSSPRFKREDATTGYIARLDFFRYASQNQQQAHHKTNTNADITKQEEKDYTQDAVVKGKTVQGGSQTGAPPLASDSAQRDDVPVDAEQKPAVTNSTDEIVQDEQAGGSANMPQAAEQSVVKGKVPATDETIKEVAPPEPEDVEVAVKESAEKQRDSVATGKDATDKDGKTASEQVEPAADLIAREPSPVDDAKDHTTGEPKATQQGLGKAEDAEASESGESLENSQHTQGPAAKSEIEGLGDKEAAPDVVAPPEGNREQGAAEQTKQSVAESENSKVSQQDKEQLSPEPSVADPSDTQNAVNDQVVDVEEAAQ
jgi:tetratricopeptide (TPR) repeat protein